MHMVRYSKLLSKTVLNTQFGAELPKLWPKMWFSLIFPTWSNMVKMGKSGEGPSRWPFALIFFSNDIILIFYDDPRQNLWKMTGSRVIWRGSRSHFWVNFEASLRKWPKLRMDFKTISRSGSIFSTCGYAYHPYAIWAKKTVTWGAKGCFWG